MAPWWPQGDVCWILPYSEFMPSSNIFDKFLLCMQICDCNRNHRGKLEWRMFCLDKCQPVTALPTLKGCWTPHYLGQTIYFGGWSLKQNLAFPSFTYVWFSIHGFQLDDELFFSLISLVEKNTIVYIYQKYSIHDLLKDFIYFNNRVAHECITLIVELR